VLVVLVATLVPAAPAAAAGDTGLDALRAEIARMREDYESRIAALERRVEVAESVAQGAQSVAQGAQLAARGAQSAAQGAERAAAAPAAPQSSASAFNPAFSTILQGRYAAFTGPEGFRQIPGFLLGEETGRGPKGLSLSETEFDISANIDDQFYGFVDFALNQENGSTSIELEEAYLETLALPAGFTVKAGQFFSAIGYQNARHSHVWDFVDQPLAYEALLGNQLLDAGIQVSWVAPTDTYLELGGELFSGDGFPGAGHGHRGVGSRSLFVKLGGDVGDSHSWRAGLSYLGTNPRGRISEGANGNLSFTGQSDILAADLVWKWAPGGNVRERNFIFQTEYLIRRERGRLGMEGAPSDGHYRGRGHGFYVQGTYQFVPRWRAGVRYGQVFSSNDVSDPAATALLRDDLSPWKASAMIDFSNSEFSRLRFQVSHEGGGLGDDNLFFLQYIMSIGSHGAHEF